MVSTDYSLLGPSANGPDKPEESEDIFFENLAIFTLDNLEKARDTLTELMKGLEGTERNKVSYIRDQVDKFIEQLKKSKKGGILGKIFKALGIVGLILAALVACLVPTPMTIAVFAVALVMVMEPLLAEAAGHDSLIQKGMGEMMKGLSEVFGPIGGAIVGAIIILVLVLAITAAAAGGISAAGSAIGQSTSATAQFLRQLPALLKNFITGELTVAQQGAILRFLEAMEAAITMAQGGLQFEMGRLQLEIANLMHAFNIDQAFIDLINNLLLSIGQDISAYQEQIQRLLEFMPQYFAPLNA
ncbi:type III secretion system translocon subunit SctE [Limnobacter sp.]|uniref:type III secretion system translocon subunit SctE n=1 Tax=Limnobacter sp. TaxID=2003368 RepID=UPI002FE3C5A7